MGSPWLETVAGHTSEQAAWGLGICHENHQWRSQALPWCGDSLGTLSITFLAPKRIRLNSGPLCHCHRHASATNSKKWHTFGAVCGRRKPLMISLFPSHSLQGWVFASLLAVFSVKLSFAALCLRQSLAWVVKMLETGVPRDHSTN